MRNKWKGWVAFQELEYQYGTSTAIAMMEDASKTESFVKHPDASRSAIVTWRHTGYEYLWRNRICSG